MSLASRLSAPDTRRGRGASNARRSPRPAPYEKPPSSAGGADGLWSHDKFAEVNDMPQGSLAGRIGGGEVNKPGGSKIFNNALAATGDDSKRGQRTRTASGGINIKGISNSTTTVEIRELIAGTTVDDVKLIFGTVGEIKGATAVPSKDPSTVAIRLTYTNRQDMLNAIQEFNGKTADGRTLSVVEVSGEIAPRSTARDRDLLDDGNEGRAGKMYADAIGGGTTQTRPPRIETESNWSRGRGGRGGGGRRGRGGRGRGAKNNEGMDMD